MSERKPQVLRTALKKTGSQHNCCCFKLQNRGQRSRAPRANFRTLDSAPQPKPLFHYTTILLSAMSQMYNMQLVFLGSLLCVVFSRTAALPAFSTRSLETEGDGPSLNDLDSLKLIFGLTRSTRHADGLFTSGYSKLLGQLSAKDYLESLSKRVNGELMDSPGKRHSDAVFTDNYSRFRKQMAVKKYLNSVLAGKRSLEDGGLTDVSMRAEPSSQQVSDDISMEELINQLSMVL